MGSTSQLEVTATPPVLEDKASWKAASANVTGSMAPQLAFGPAPSLCKERGLSTPQALKDRSLSKPLRGVPQMRVLGKAVLFPVHTEKMTVT